MKYFIGVDIGTTTVKSVAFNVEGQILAKRSVENKTIYPFEGYAEQDPEEIYKAVIECNEEIIQELKVNPQFISFSAAMHGLIAMDGNGNKLTNCFLWSDQRAVSEANNLHMQGIAQSLYKSTGVPVQAMSPLCKIIWLQKHDPDLCTRTAKFIGLKEYVFYKLFQTYIIDKSIASATGLMNLENAAWDNEILHLANIDSTKLSEIVPVNYQLVKDGMVYIVGASDGASANLAMGVSSNTQLAITIGTSAAARVTINTQKRNPEMRLFCYHLNEEQYIYGGASNNGAIVLQWLKESILESQLNIDQLVEKAKTVNPGSDGLIFIPYLSGERAPIWNSNAKAFFCNLTIQHGQSHLIRAVMESVLYNLLLITQEMDPENEIKEIHAGGGFAENAFWVQMLADIFNIPVKVYATNENSALGAVMIEAAITMNSIQTYQPDPQTHISHLKTFEKFKELVQGII